MNKPFAIKLHQFKVMQYVKQIKRIYLLFAIYYNTLNKNVMFYNTIHRHKKYVWFQNSLLNLFSRKSYNL